MGKSCQPNLQVILFFMQTITIRKSLSLKIIFLLSLSFCKQRIHNIQKRKEIKKKKLKKIEISLKSILPTMLPSHSIPLPRNIFSFSVSLSRIFYTHSTIICLFQIWNPISLMTPGCFSWKMALQDHVLGTKDVHSYWVDLSL